MGRSSRAAVRRPRPVWHQALLLHLPRRYAALRLGGQGDPAASGGAGARLQGGAERVLLVPERPDGPHAVRWDPPPAPGAHALGAAGRSRLAARGALLGLRVSRGGRRLRGGVRGAAGAALRAGGEPAARERRGGGRLPERRHRLGCGDVGGGAQLSAPQDVHRGVRPLVRLGAGAGLRRAAQGGVPLQPIPDGALRGRAEGGRHGAGDAGADLAPGRPARGAVLPQLLRLAPRIAVREGGALGSRRR
jgi:hypothetical protein